MEKHKVEVDAAILAVDLQNGFISEPDELPVPDGLQVVPIINRLMHVLGVRLASQDWHTPRHGSFASSHPGVAPFDTGLLAGIPQVFWPDHCVAGTRGAMLHRSFDDRPVQAIFRKGSDPLVDSYSVFSDNAGKNPTGLHGYLRDRGVRKLYLAGLALDYCVLFTARDARRLMPDLQVAVIVDACRPVAERSGAEAIAELRTLGVTLIESSRLLPL